jgi:hypothetical protein
MLNDKAIAGFKSEFRGAVIEPGDSTGAIATNLRREGLIRIPQMFTLLVRMQGFDGNLQAGNYLLRPNMTMSQIISALQIGIKVEEKEITIVEGKNRQVRRMIESLDGRVPSGPGLRQPRRRNPRLSFDRELVQQEVSHVPRIFVRLEDLLDVNRSHTARAQSVGERLVRQLCVDCAIDNVIVRLRRRIESRERIGISLL